MSGSSESHLPNLSETYEKATGDANLSSDMRDFCLYFAEKTGILEGEN